MLAEGQSPLVVAQTLNVSRRTVERWLDKPEFKSRLESAKGKAMEALANEVFEKCRTALTKGLPKSIRRVVDALDHPDARIQIRAAEAIAKWSGFYQPTPTKTDQQGLAEQNLKGYLAYLEMNNGNGNQHKPVRE